MRLGNLYGSALFSDSEHITTFIIKIYNVKKEREESRCMYQIPACPISLIFLSERRELEPQSGNGPIVKPTNTILIEIVNKREIDKLLI